MAIAHYKIILAYNGTEFVGFQRQRQGRTVQAEFESALRKIGWDGDSIIAAGRTDAGVHARGQVISFGIEWQHSTDDLLNALNYYLPIDTAVRSVEEVRPDFHPRFDAKFRRYSYQIFCASIRDPLREGFAWRVWPLVDIERMNLASAALIGAHDFRAFGKSMTEGGSTMREVYSAGWIGSGNAWRFEITANAFLYHMARRITFGLVQVGLGRLDEHAISTSLASGRLDPAGLAPSAGLVLEEVIY